MKIIELYETDKKDIYMDIDGNVYSTKLDRIYKLSKYKMQNGYEYISVREDGTVKCILVSRLMGNAFLGLDLNNRKLQMNHINKIRHDNKLSNLEIVTPKQNMLHAKGYKDYKEVE